MDRAQRRAEKERNKARARRFLKETRHSSGSDADWLERTTNRWASHGKLCSCYMCGNPRRHFGALTMQERRATDASIESIRKGAEIYAPALRRLAAR